MGWGGREVGVKLGAPVFTLSDLSDYELHLRLVVCPEITLSGRQDAEVQ